MQNKILTISIAAYNAHKYIDECISSLIGIKNFDKLDIIIVDDGSKDDTYNLAKVYEEKFPNSIKVIKKENGGWGSTINTSLKIASGKYFKILDVDDRFYTSNLDEFIAFLDNSNTDIVSSPYSFYYVGKDKYEVINNYRYEMHSLTFRTSMLKEKNITITEKCFYADVEVSLKGIKYAKTFVKFNKPIYIYSIGIGDQSISDNSFKRNIDQHFTILKNLLTNDYSEVMESDNFDEEIKNVYNDRLLEMINKHYSVLFKFSPNKENKQRIIDFDNWLKNTSTSLYNACNLSRVKLFRKNNGLYPIIYTFLKLRNTVYNMLRGNK